MSSPSAEDHRRLLRDYADATEQFRNQRVLSALGGQSTRCGAPSLKALGGFAVECRDLPDRRWHLPTGVLRGLRGFVRRTDFR
jgi:hypothetical protein